MTYPMTFWQILYIMLCSYLLGAVIFYYVGKLIGESKWMIYYLDKVVAERKRCKEVIEHYRKKLYDDGERWKDENKNI